MSVTTFEAGKVTVEVVDRESTYTGVPPSRWRTDRAEQVGRARVAKLTADDGLRARVVLVTWPEDGEVSLGHAELFGGPSDYERLEDAGVISPKVLDVRLVARIRALRYGNAGRASGAAVEWEQIDEWCGQDARSFLERLGASRAGTYGELYPGATKFKLEPAIEVAVENPVALFGVYALTRVMPIMMGYGKSTVEGPNA